MVRIDNELKKLIESNAMALATIDKNNNPHAIAVAYIKVVGNDKVLITDNYMNETTKNIQKNNNIALVVWNKNWKTNCKGFELRGKTKYFASGKWKEFAKKLPGNKGEPVKGVMITTISKIKKLA